MTQKQEREEIWESEAKDLYSKMPIVSDLIYEEDYVRQYVNARRQQYDEGNRDNDFQFHMWRDR